MTHYLRLSMVVLGYQDAAIIDFIKPLILTVCILALYLGVVEVLPHLSRRLWQRATGAELPAIGYYILDMTVSIAFVYIVSQQFSISWVPSTWTSWPSPSPSTWTAWQSLLGLALLPMAVIAILMINERMIEHFLQGKLVKSYRQYRQMLDVLFSHYPSFPLKIILIAPVVEEVMVRGILQGIVLFPSNDVAALLAAALVFSIIHINPYQVAASIVPSLLLGILYYLTHTLILCIAVHFAINLYSLYHLKSDTRNRARQSHEQPHRQ